MTTLMVRVTVIHDADVVRMSVDSSVYLSKIFPLSALADQSYGAISNSMTFRRVLLRLESLPSSPRAQSSGAADKPDCLLPNSRYCAKSGILAALPHYSV